MCVHIHIHMHVCISDACGCVQVTCSGVVSTTAGVVDGSKVEVWRWEGPACAMAGEDTSANYREGIID